MSTIRLPADDIGFTEILLRCDCHDLTHVASVGYFNDEGELYLEVAYDHYTPFWRRVWITIKYLCGLRHRSCGEIVLDKEDAKQLKAFLEDFVNREVKNG